MLHLVAFEGDD